MPGPTFLRTAAQQLRGRTPVIIMTGADRMLDALGETRRWAFGILKKPFDLEHLREIIEHALRQRAVYVTAHRQAERIQELEARIRDLVTQNQVLFEEARLDALTCLPNRRRLHEDLGRLYANAERYDRPFALALLDVDNFRRYNQEQGYAGGDRAIRRVAELLHGAVRKGDTVYRFGGDEFVVVMQAEALEQAVTAADRLREAVARASGAGEGSVEGPITLSTGVAWVEPGEPRSISALIQRADEHLRKAKLAGGNTVFPQIPSTVAEKTA
jgi:diguanylate cyclase (GGDEF)-like protein